MADFHQLMERLVKMEDSQYSYRNTLLATNSEGITAGIIVSYDGAQLKALRKRFIEEAKETFGIDYTGMDPETQEGELYIDSICVKPEYRGKAIGRDIVASCERLARGEGRGRVWCGVNAKALPVQQFFKARGYRSLGPAESEGGIERNELIFERML